MTFLTRRNKIVFAIGIALAAGGFVWQSATHPAVSATTNKPKAALAVTLTQLGPDFSFQVTDRPSLATPPLARVGSSAAKNKTNLPVLS